MKAFYINFVMICILILSLFGNAVAMQQYKDPFYYEINSDCEKKTAALLTQLQKWKFNGVILQQGSSYQKIWLTSSHQLLIVSKGSTPQQLQPWHITQIRIDQVSWQANLAGDCGIPIVWVMKLNEANYLDEAENEQKYSNNNNKE